MYNNESLLTQLNAINDELSEYKELQNAIFKKLQIMNKLANSDEFENAVLEWARAYPEEALIYFLSNKEQDETLITYGSLILGGLYLNFNGYFYSVLKETDRVEDKYLFENTHSRERRIISVKDIIKTISKYINTQEDMTIKISDNGSNTMLPIAINNITMNNGEVYVGKLEFEPILKSKIYNIIESNFIVKELFNNEEKPSIIEDFENDTISITHSFIAKESNKNVIPFGRTSKHAL